MSDSSSNSSCSSCLGCFGLLLVAILVGSSVLGGSSGFSMKIGPFAASIGSGTSNEQKNSGEVNQHHTDPENITKEVSAELSKFHDSLDKGNFKEIYERSSHLLKKSISEQDFSQILQKTQNLCGKSKSSEVLNIWKPIAGSNVGEYLLSRHMTVFEKSSFVEEFTWLSSNGKLTLINFQVIPVPTSDKIPTNKT